MKFSAPDSRSILNGVALLALTGLAALMCFRDVPAPNGYFVSAIIGGLLTYLTGEAAKAVSPQNPQP